MSTPGNRPDPVTEPLFDLQRLTSGIRWRRRMWTATALLGLILGGTLAVLMPAHTAVTRILVIHEDDQGAVRETLMDTDVALLETTQTAADALERLGVDERPDRFLRKFTGDGLTGNVMEITVSGSSDQDATARAQALAETFIAGHVQRTKDSATAEAQALLDRRAETERVITEVNDSIADVTARPPGPDATAELETLYARRAALANLSQELGQRAEDAGVGAPRVEAGTRIVDFPRVTSSSLPSAAATNAAVGLVLGLGIGIALAAVASVVQDRPILRRDIAAQVGASVIVQLAPPRRGPSRLWKGSRAVTERKRAAATLVRFARDAPGSLSLLEIGCPQVAAGIALDMAGELALERTVLVVDDLPGGQLRQLAAAQASPVEIVDGADLDSAAAAHTARSRDRRIGVGSVEPGTAWTDLRRLGTETVLVVRAGRASALWLHTVARQLADQDVLVLGVVLVHPDPKDRSDGTLWDAMHTALRGRVGIPGAPQPAAAADVAAADVPVADVPVADVPVADVPVAEPDLAKPTADLAKPNADVAPVNGSAATANGKAPAPAFAPLSANGKPVTVPSPFRRNGGGPAPSPAPSPSTGRAPTASSVDGHPTAKLPPVVRPASADPSPVDPVEVS